MKKILIIFPPSNRHLGLWKDLENDQRVILRCSAKRKLNKFSHFILKCLFHFNLKFVENLWNKNRFGYHDIYSLANSVEHILIIDGALNQIIPQELEKCRKINPKLKISLYLINSMNAKSLTMRNLTNKLCLYKWDNIFTFDPEDAKNYGFQFLGFNYYSKPHIIHNPNNNSDVYFVGGLKGGRDSIIFSVFEYLIQNSIKTEYDINTMDSNSAIIDNPNINYFKTWRPYSEILKKIQSSKCILEIMQEGQSGATLRYFEAVSMNKKLLTNNQKIKSYPFYNPKWMKIFRTAADIDIKWLLEDEIVDYKYNNEFSPVHLVDYLLRTY